MSVSLQVGLGIKSTKENPVYKLYVREWYTQADKPDYTAIAELSKEMAMLLVSNKLADDNAGLLT